MSYQPYELRQVMLDIPARRRQWESLLEARGLRPGAAGYVAGLYDCDDRLAATASLDGNVIKYVAVDPDADGEGLAATLITHLRDRAAGDYDNVLVFTKPEYAPTFTALAFHEVGRAPKAVLLESDPDGIAGYCRTLRQATAGGQGAKGVAVMNCNPFTLGHKHLIDKALEDVDKLFVIPVRRDGDDEVLSTTERHSMILMGNIEAVASERLLVCPSSQYAVSSATFPTYFLKNLDEAAETQMRLDLDIFGRHIAPALGVVKRFVGTEPLDPMTRRYNELMREILPPHGVEVVEIPRMETNGEPVSASVARRLWGERRLAEAAALMPEGSPSFLLGRDACRALRQELDTTPKPGLVDRRDSGAHRDMDHRTMLASIEALRSHFIKIAAGTDDGKLLALQGLDAEKDMLEATEGVNTHRGALFSLGLAVNACGLLLRGKLPVTSESLKNKIASMAAQFAQPRGTHGYEVSRKYGIPTALDNARAGYAAAFGDYLPYFRSLGADPWRNHKTLLRIMAAMDDANVYHRAGRRGADYVKRLAADTLNDFSRQALERANGLLVDLNISPGGAADMLSLTLLLDMLLPLQATR